MAVMDKRKPILALDFDGVIHSYTSGWKGADVIPDPPVEGVFDFLYEAIKVFDVQIYSSRSGQEGGINAMQIWLRQYENRYRVDNGLDFKNPLCDAISFPTEKPPAMITIDDRALTFTGNWKDFNPEKLLNFKPWNK